MPKPKPGEKKEAFVSRCMAYPDLRDRPAKQRAGECYGLWHEHHPTGKKHAGTASEKSRTGTCGCEGCRKEEALRASLQKVITLKKQDLQSYTLPALGVQCSDTELSATGVLATADPDLVGDLVIPAGVNLHHHQLNPVVLLEHNLVAGKWPVGQCESPQGEYTVLLDGDRLLQKSFFSQSLPDAKQTYLLVKEGILRGNSMGFKEDDVAPRGGGGRVIRACRLYEVTWTCLPMNPYALDTLTSIFSRGRLDNEPLTLTIKSMLQPWVLPRKFFPTDIKDTHMFLNHKSQDDYEEKDQGGDDQPQDDMEVEQKSDEPDESPAEERSLKDKADEQEGKGGERFLKALIGHLNQLRDEVGEGADEIDNERVAACLERFDEQIDEVIADLQADLEDEYGGDGDDSDEEGADEEKSRKSRKAQKSRKSQKGRKPLRRKSQDADDEPEPEEKALERSIERKLRLLEKLQQS